MNMKIKMLAGVTSVLLLAAGCLKDPKVTVYASFTTEKDVYEINEDIYLTNTSYAENARIVSSKWEWDGKHKWGLQLEEPISFSTVGDYEIRLTAATESNISASFVKTVKIQDTNIRPVADFTFEPQEGIKAGDPVQFTDLSTDEDGEIVAWEWRFGSTVVNEPNPVFTFAEFGDIKVSLTVTDNMKGTNTKTVVIPVEKSIYSLELVWEQTYESNSDAFVKFTSPSTNADGSVVYAFSTGYNLVAFSKDGEKLWSFDANKHNPSPLDKSGTMKVNSCPPVVDSDGTVFINVGYNESSDVSRESGVYAVNSDGSEKWYFPFGNARYIAVHPVIADGHVILTTKSNPTKEQFPDLWQQYGSLDNGHVLDKGTGAFVQTLKVKRGSYGGAIAIHGDRFISHCDDKYGSRIYFNEGGTWKHYGPDDNQSAKSLGYYNSTTLESGESSQMAADKDGRVYLLYSSKTGRVSNASVLYCYDTDSYVKDADTPYEPEWTVGINGAVTRYNALGVVCGADGTVYVTTGSSGDTEARVTAVTSEGSVKWESLADGNIAGSAAVDNEGYIYYNDYSLGKLVKLDPATGNRVAEIQLCSDMRSSPAISADGTIYCVGIKDDCPTLFAVRGTATGPADSWSQLGGNPSRNCILQ